MKTISGALIFLAGCFLWNGLVQECDGSDCRRVAQVHVVRQVHYAPAQIHHQYQQYQHHQRAVYYPPLSIGYQPDNNELLEKFFNAYKQKAEQHEETLKALIATGLQPQHLKDQLAPPHPGAALLRNDCARCHSAEDKAIKGGKRIYFTNGVLTATDEEAGEMLDAVEAGRMPKDRKWTDKEKASFGFFMLRRPPPPDVSKLPKR